MPPISPTSGMSRPVCRAAIASTAWAARCSGASPINSSTLRARSASAPAGSNLVEALRRDLIARRCRRRGHDRDHLALGASKYPQRKPHRKGQTAGVRHLLHNPRHPPVAVRLLDKTHRGPAFGVWITFRQRPIVLEGKGTAVTRVIRAVKSSREGEAVVSTDVLERNAVSLIPRGGQRFRRPAIKLAAVRGRLRIAIERIER